MRKRFAILIPVAVVVAVGWFHSIYYSDAMRKERDIAKMEELKRIAETYDLNDVNHPVKICYSADGAAIYTSRMVEMVPFEYDWKSGEYFYLTGEWHGFCYDDNIYNHTVGEFDELFIY